MRRGEIWTAAGGSNYAGKPRPWVVVQADDFEIESSIILCGFTSEPGNYARLRPRPAPTAGNGLRESSRVMVDKITALPRNLVDKHVGELSPEDMERVDRALRLILALAGTPRSKPAQLR